MALALQILVILACLLLGVHYGGIGLGLISGVGLVILVFVFGLTPGEPPVDVMLTILAVIGCASVLQGAGGLNVMMQFAEKILRRHPKYITILAPITTWTLTLMCGTGHVVYTMFPIIGDIAIKNNIRPERPMAAASVASQMGITASPVSVATVSLVSILAAKAGVGESYSIPQILMISIPASLSGVLLAALWSMRRGKDLDDDPEFQRKIADPDQYALIYGSDETLLTQRFPKEAFRSTWIFFAGIAAVVVLGAFASLRPTFVVDGKASTLSMNLAIQMAMLVAGVVTLEACVLVDLPLNFANIIALPLLLGVGVAFKIYYVTAWRAGQTHLLQTSLTHAVFFSALTTATAFGSLWFSSHPGTASMGELLALSLLCTLFAAVIFQPLLMGKPREVAGP